MKLSSLIFILFVTFLPIAAFTAPPTEPVGPIKPVEVLNTPSVIIESIPNITIQNDSQAPVPVNIVDGGENGLQTRFIGVVNSQFDGHITHPDGKEGYYAMHQYCKDTFININARACYASEVSELPLSTNGFSFNWVIRSRDVDFLFDNQGSRFVYDAGSGALERDTSNTGFSLANNLDCGQHLINSSDVRGQVVNIRNGSILTQSCDQSFGIACCSIESVPTTPPPEPDPTPN